MTKTAEKAIHALTESGTSSALAVADHLETVASNGREHATNKSLIAEAQALIESAEWFLGGMGLQKCDRCGEWSTSTSVFADGETLCKGCDENLITV